VASFNPGGGGQFATGISPPGAGEYRIANTFSINNTGGGSSHDHTLSANFSGSANSVLQPGLVLNYIIKT
jgi:hypothetical protein